MPDNARLFEEVQKLKEKWPVTWYREPCNEVEIANLRTPTGWSPARITVIYDLPADYPDTPPEIYLPDEMEYHDEQSGRPHILLRTSRQDCYHMCLHDHAWDPSKHTLVSMKKLLMEGLNNPRDGKRRFETG